MAEIKKKKNKRGVGLLSIVLMILAFAFFVYGVVVVFILGTGHWFNFIWLIGGVVLLLLSFLFSGHAGLPAVVKAILGLAILACVVNFGIFTVKAVLRANAGADETAKWVIVLGAKVNGSDPSVEFRARLNKTASFVSAVDLKARAADPNASLSTIITTGGQGEDEGAAEGEVGARVLAALGIAPTRIIIENQSSTTQENLRFAKDLIVAKGGTVYDPVLIVSSGFHLYRAERLAWAEGFENVTGLGSVGLPELVPHYYVREYAAYVKEATLGHFTR